MTAARFFLCLVLLCVVSASVVSAAPRHLRRGVIAPLHVRINHLSVDTHPVDLVVDSAHPRFSWQLADEFSGSAARPMRGLSQTAYQLQLLKQAAHGGYGLLEDGGDTGVVPSNQTTQVSHPASLLPNSRYLLRVRYWSSSGAESGWTQARFRTAMMGTWRDVPAKWIGSTVIPMHKLRKEFTLPSSGAAEVTAATVQMSGIGYSHLFLDGKKVDESRTNDPGWTTYERRTLYISLAVDELLSSGANAVGVELGGGWYSQEQYITGRGENAYGPPRLWFWLSVQYSDNSTVDVYSDESWTGTTGSTVHDGVYMGSIQDLRWQRDGWNTVGFSDSLSLWVAASTLPSPLDSDGLFALQEMDPIRYPPDNLHFATSASQHLGSASQPASIAGGDLLRQNGGVIQPVDLGGRGEGQVMDLRQNIAGWCRFIARGKRGMSILVRYAEAMSLPNPQVDGSLYTENLRGAASTDIFIFSKDDEPETFEPPFTQHGFRYIEFRGAKNGIRAEDVTCFFIHSETTVVGNFTSSNAVMNQIQHNIQWGQLSNMMSLPTDCDQRDERKGWMGDAGLTVDENLFNFDTAAFYLNFLNLIRDIQDTNGAVSDTVPLTYGNRPADPNWGTAYPTIAWTLWDHYGDLDVLKDHFKSIRAWVENVKAGWANTGLKNIWYEYGDWVPPPPYGQTDGHLISSFPFMRDVLTVARMAHLLNDSATEKTYVAFYQQLAQEFHSTFYNSADVGYSNGMQTANALALALPGVVPDNLTDAVVAALVKDVQDKGHITTGIVGVAQLFPVLSAHKQHDVALMLAQSITYPSYGWMFSNEIENATTLWELWDSPREGPGMNSRNHIMFGSIGAWFYRDVAGIALNGLQELRIRPRMGYDHKLMPSLHAEVVTVKGPVTVDYTRVAGSRHSIFLSVTVPHNTRALVQLEPLLRDGSCSLLKEANTLLYSADTQQVVKTVDGVHSVDVEKDGTMSVRVSAGSYQFTAFWQ